MKPTKLGSRRPLRTESYHRRDDSRERAGNAYVHSLKVPRPSELFDWDAALFIHAQTMRDRGYPLSAQQKEMLKHA